MLLRYATLQKDPMTQQEVEELVLKLNQIEVRWERQVAGVGGFIHQHNQLVPARLCLSTHS